MLIGTRKNSYLNPFGTFFSGLNTDLGSTLSWSWPELDYKEVIPVDVVETETEIVVTAECPGVNAEDINISVQGKVLTISVTKTDREQTEKKEFVRVERAVGTFTRRVRLSCLVNDNTVDAYYVDGVLSIALQKAEEKISQKIEVKTKKALDK